MNAMVLSAYFAMFVAVLAVWIAVSVNRAAPADKMATTRYPGVDLDAAVSAWTKKSRLGKRPSNFERSA